MSKCTDLHSYNLHLFDFNERPPSVERINPLLTINEQTVEPLFVYNAQDAGHAWPSWGYGSNLDHRMTNADIPVTPDVVIYNVGSPLFGKRDDSITMIGGINYQKVPYGTADSTYNVTTEDVVVRIIYRVYSDINGRPVFANCSQTTANQNGYSLWAGNYCEFNIKDTRSGDGYGVRSSALSAGWVDAIIFMDRSSGSQIYINGIRSGSAGTSTTKSITSEGPFALGLYPGSDYFHGTFAYVALWKKDSWLDSHLQDSLAAKMFQDLTGIYPRYYVGTPTPTYSRNSTAYLEKYEYGVRKLYRVGTNWPRTCSVKDLGNNIITGYFSESESTNLLLQSETLGTTWTQVALTSISNNDAYGPEGPKLTYAYPVVGTLDGLIGNASNTQHGIIQIITLAEDTYCLSCWVRPGDKTWCYLFNSTVSNCYVYFNLSGEIGTIGDGVLTCNIEQYDGDLYRIWMTFSGTVASHTVGLYAANADEDNDFAGDTTTVNIHAGCFQCEAKVYPSSYIPTTTASVTRELDSLTYDGDNISEGQGQIFANIYSYKSSNGYICELDDIKVGRKGDLAVAQSADYILTGETDIVDGYIHQIQHFWTGNGADLAVDFARDCLPVTTCTIPSVSTVSVGNLFNGLIRDLKIYSSFSISENTYNTKDWTTNYPNYLDTSLQMMTIEDHLDRLRAAQLHALRDSLKSIQRQVGSNIVEPESLSYRISELEKSGIIYFSCVADLLEYPIDDLNHMQVVYVDGYYSPGDGGGERKYLDLSMTLGESASNGGTIIYANDGKENTNSTKAYWRSVKWSGDVRVFGVKGGVDSDDTSKLRTAVRVASDEGLTVLLDNIDIYLRGHIYIYNRCCLLGNNAVIYLDGIIVPEGEPDPVEYLTAYFGVGLKELGEYGTGRVTDAEADTNTSIWKGYIKNITLITTERNNVSLGGAVFKFCQSKDCVVDNVKLFSQNTIGNTLAFSQTLIHSYWINGDSGRKAAYGFKNFTIQNCFIDTWKSQKRDIGGTENFGIDFSGAPNAYFHGLKILNNTIIGTSDDIIALHGVRDVKVIGNTCFPMHGRILLNSVRDAVCANNYVEKLVRWPSGNLNTSSWSYYIDDESCVAGKPGRILMINNIAKVPEISAESGHHFPAFRIACAFDTICANNVFINDNPGTIFSGELESYKPIGCDWEPGDATNDPLGNDYPFDIYPDTVPGYVDPYCARIYNLKIINNKFIGKYPKGLMINLMSVPPYDSKIFIKGNHCARHVFQTLYEPTYVDGVTVGRSYYNDCQADVTFLEGVCSIPNHARENPDALYFAHQCFTTDGYHDFLLNGSETIADFQLYKNFSLMEIKVRSDQVLKGSDQIIFTVVKTQNGGPGPSFNEYLNYDHTILNAAKGTELDIRFHNWYISSSTDIIFKPFELIKVTGRFFVSDIGLYDGSKLNVIISVEGMFF